MLQLPTVSPTTVISSQTLILHCPVTSEKAVSRQDSQTNHCFHEPALSPKFLSSLLAEREPLFSTGQHGAADTSGKGQSC